MATSLVAQKGDRLDVDIDSILRYIVVGAIVGIVARLLIPRTTGMGLLVTIAVGIVGAVIGGWLAGAVFEETTGVDWIASILVAAMLARSPFRDSIGPEWPRSRAQTPGCSALAASPGGSTARPPCSSVVLGRC